MNKRDFLRGYLEAPGPGLATKHRKIAKRVFLTARRGGKTLSLIQFLTKQAKQS